MHDISTKTLTALILIPPFTALVIWGSPLLILLLLVLPAVSLGLYEFFAMSLLPERRADAWVGIGLGLVLPVVFYLNPHHVPLAISSIFLMILLFSFACHFKSADFSPMIPHTSKMFFGILYVAFLLSFLAPLKSLEAKTDIHWLSLLFLVTWGGDAGAYFVGKYLGKHKVVPTISPKKTLEGFIGGFIVTIALILMAKGLFAQGLSWSASLGIGIGIGVLGPIGDLFESMMKRGAAIKDSAQLIPGHGGILDRSDSIGFVAPFLFYYAVILTENGF